MTIEAKAVLKALGSRPIAYHPAVAKALKSVNAALIICQLMYWDGKGALDDGWIVKTNEDFTDELGMSEHELETARKRCMASGVLQYKRKGMPAKSRYRLNLDALVDLLAAFTSQAETAEQDSGKAPNQLGGKDPACSAGRKGDMLGGKRLTNIRSTESTTEITAETTEESRASREKRAPARPAWELIEAIAVACDMNPKIKSVAGRCGRVAKDLMAVEATPDQVKVFAAWARLNWWRCQKSNQLYPEDLPPNWQQAMKTGAKPSTPPSANRPGRASDAEAEQFRNAMRAAAMGGPQ